MGERTDGLLKRRGMLAGMAAFAGAALAKLAGAERVEAGHSTTVGTDFADRKALHLGETNNVPGGTFIAIAGSTSAQGFRVSGYLGHAAISGQNTTAGKTGVHGLSNDVASTSTGKGVEGDTYGGGLNASGVYGIARAGQSNGVWGENTSATDGNAGVYGLASNTSSLAIGVFGRTRSSHPGAAGVFGEVTATNGGNVGVYGRTASTNAGAAGMYGEAVASGASGTGVFGRASGGIGVRGQSVSNTGVFGGSNTGIGVYADSVSNSAIFAAGPRGVWGRTTAGIGMLAQATQGGTVQNRSYGLYAAAPGPGWAGYFEGNVYVTGSVTQAGNAPATSTALVADGTTRALYSQDSTEPVVEDLGEAKLAGGRFEVKLDPDFASVADAGSYQVFLTPYADCKGMAVTARGPGGFTVAELQGGTSGVGFGYRVVAKRKGATGKRLERLERPKGLDAKDLEPPKLPEPAPAPEKPTEPRPEPPRPGR